MATLTAASVSALWGCGARLSTLAIPAGQLLRCSSSWLRFGQRALAHAAGRLRTAVGPDAASGLSLLVWQGFKRRSPLPVLLVLLAHMLVRQRRRLPGAASVQHLCWKGY